VYFILAYLSTYYIEISIFILLHILKEYIERCDFMIHRKRRNIPYVARNKIVKKTQVQPELIDEVPPELPLLNEELLLDDQSNIRDGHIRVRVSTALGALPVRDAVVTVYLTDEEGEEHALYHLVSDISGQVPLITVPVVYDPSDPRESPEYFFSTYNLRVQAIGYYTQNILDVRVFPDTTTNFNISLVPVMQGGTEEDSRTIVIPPSPIDISNE